MSRLGVDDSNGVHSDLPIGQLLANGQRLQLVSQTELLTLAVAATSVTAMSIPAGAIVFGVPTRVTVLIPTAATFLVTLTQGAVALSGAVAVAAGTTDRGNLLCPSLVGAAATTITITPNAQPAQNTGRLRVTAFYFLVTPPTL
jgi:hypothetical protein